MNKFRPLRGRGPRKIVPPERLNTIEAYKYIRDHVLDIMPAIYKIKNKAGKLVPFNPSVVQRDIICRWIWNCMVQQTGMRLVILKARQMYVSTGCAVLNHFSTWTETNVGGLMSHNSDSTKTIWNNYYRTLAAHMPRKGPLATPVLFDNENELRYKLPVLNADKKIEWAEGGGAVIYPVGARAEGGLISRPVNHLHLSEVGYPSAWASVLADTMSAMVEDGNTWVIMESIAVQAAGYFFNQWRSAMNGITNFTPVFYPWVAHREYRTTLTEEEERRLEVGDGSVIEPYGSTTDEQAIDKPNMDRIRNVVNEYWGIDKLKSPAVAKRRHMFLRIREEALKYRNTYIIPMKILSASEVSDLKRGLQLFDQQYPSHWDDPWLTLGKSVFDPKIISERQNSCRVRSIALSAISPALRPKFPRWLDDDQTVWLIRQPDPRGNYLIVFDGSEGIDDKTRDAFAAIVWNWRTMKADAIQHGRGKNFREQVKDLVRLGYYYTTNGKPSEIVIEREPHSTLSHIDELTEQLKYPNYYCFSRFEAGRRTSPQVGFPIQKEREDCINALIAFLPTLPEDAIDFEPFWHEMSSFGYGNDGKIRALGTAKDDLVMPLAVCARIGQQRDLWGSHDYEPIDQKQIEPIDIATLPPEEEPPPKRKAPAPDRRMMFMDKTRTRM